MDKTVVVLITISVVTTLIYASHMIASAILAGKGGKLDTSWTWMALIFGPLIAIGLSR